MKEFRQTVICAFFIFASIFNSLTSDPCSTKDELPFIENRITSFVPDAAAGESHLCDYSIIPSTGKWYTVQDHDMITNASGHFTCGTEFAIWLNGDIPDTPGEHDREACVPGFYTDCDEKLPIKIRVCEEYRIYFLKPPSSCPTAYCFGYGDGVGPPDAVVQTPSVNFSFIENVLPNGKTQKFASACEFDSVPGSVNYLYQVYWYIQGSLDSKSKIVPYSEISSTHLLEGTNKFRRIGIDVACAVRLRYSIKGTPGKSSNMSRKFFAGMQTERTSFVIRENETVSIAVHLTVPFGCSYNEKGAVEPCELFVEIFIPPITGKCSGEIGYVGENKNCGLEIRNTEWSSKHFFNISWMNNGEYPNPEYAEGQYLLHLKVRRHKPHEIWSDHELAPIHIQFQSTGNSENYMWTGLKCYAHSDPHMLTFDGRDYDHHMDGTYILYENNGKEGKTKMQVQIQLAACGTTVKCVCGVAIRAGRDVFVINRCPGFRKFLGYKSCTSDNLIDARRDKSSELKYVIYFPSETHVTVIIGRYKDMLEVDVNPSRIDVNNSRGLCGILDGEKNNDFHYPDKTNAASCEDFIKSWRIDNTNSVNLFTIDEKGVEALERWDDSVSYCSCPVNSSSTITNASSCSADRTVTCSRTEISVSGSKCRIKLKRKKRSIFSFIPEKFTTEINQEKRSRRSADNLGESVHMSKDQAIQFCSEFMNKSKAFRECGKIPHVDTNQAIEECALDIQYTNSTAWAGVAREGVKNICLKELKQNGTLKEEDESGNSIAKEIKEITCQNECSGQGACVNGTCKCDEGFLSGDCSVDSNDAPTVYGVNIDDGGLCDTADCDVASVDGDMFLVTSMLTCKLELFEVSFDGQETEQSVIQTSALYNTLSNVECPLSTVRRRREAHQSNSFVHGYSISISNNGITFSTSHKLHILDSTCQDTANISGQLTFILKDGYCFIRGQCILDGTQDGTEPCRACVSSGQKFEWTWLGQKEGCKIDGGKSKPQLWIIGAVFGGGALMFVLGFITYWHKSKKNRRIETVGLNKESPPLY